MEYNVAHANAIAVADYNEVTFPSGLRQICAPPLAHFDLKGIVKRETPLELRCNREFV